MVVVSRPQTLCNRGQARQSVRADISHRQTNINNAAIIVCRRYWLLAATVAVCCSSSTVSPTSRSLPHRHALYSIRRSKVQHPLVHKWHRNGLPSNLGTSLTLPHSNGLALRKTRTPKHRMMILSTSMLFHIVKTQRTKHTTSIPRRSSRPTPRTMR